MTRYENLLGSPDRAAQTLLSTGAICNMFETCKSCLWYDKDQYLCNNPPLETIVNWLMEEVE